jgi:hypothetical protein
VSHTNGICKLYDRLRPAERVALILAASARGDEQERERLVSTGARVTYRLQDHFGRVEALSKISKLYLLQQLDLSVHLSHGVGILEAADYAPPGDRRQATARRRAERAVALVAYRIVTRASAWRLFCAGASLDTAMLLTILPGHDTAADSEALARDLTCTRDEALAFLAESGKDDARLETAEEIAEGWRQALEEESRPWE